jgi:DNA-binding MarR family transcriptional regulator
MRATHSVVATVAPATALSDLEVGEALWNVFRAVWAQGQKDCRVAGLTMPQARVMIAVDAGVSIPPSELARQLGLSRQAMSSAVQHLEDEKLVVRSHSTRDRRQVLISFTPKGRRAFGELRRAQHRIHEQVNRLFAGREKEVLVRSLGRMARELAGEQPWFVYRCTLCAARRPSVEVGR